MKTNDSHKAARGPIHSPLVLLLSHVALSSCSISPSKWAPPPPRVCSPNFYVTPHRYRSSFPTAREKVIQSISRPTNVVKFFKVAPLREIPEQVLKVANQTPKDRAVRGILLPAVTDHIPYPRRSVNRRNPRPIAPCHTSANVVQVIAREGNLLGEDLTEEDPKAVHIHRLVEGLACEELRRHVRRRARLGDTSAHQPKVAELDHSTLDEEVVGFEVPVNDARLQGVQVLHRHGHIQRDLHALVRGELEALDVEHVIKRLVAKLHHEAEVRWTHRGPKEGDHIRVVELGHDQQFIHVLLHEVLIHFRVKECLERHRSISPMAAVDHSNAPPADLLAKLNLAKVNLAPGGLVLLRIQSLRRCLGLGAPYGQVVVARLLLGALVF
mmetsp:Transcript_20952/g.61163  ORF Transcript_20952/g.61163 Transcript_20952/m.61163 type:complete len:383 (-) Transcript_20952:58-1206(-)